MSDLRFPGVLPAVVTPFSDDGGVNEEALRDLVTWLAAAGVDGVVAVGTMGEFRSLTGEERRAVTATILASVDGNLPITVGVAADTAVEASTHAREAAELGATGLLCLPPITYAADDRELHAFFEKVASATDLPLMIYNNPTGSKADLSPDFVAKLFDIDGVVAVKETSGDARRIAAIIEATDSEMEVLVGGDDWAFEGFCAGATGWVSGVANVAPSECLELLALVQSGDLDRARALYHGLLPLARLDMHPKLVQFYKAALDRIGRYGGPSRPPRLPLTDAESARVDDAVAALREVAGSMDNDSERSKV